MRLASLGVPLGAMMIGAMMIAAAMAGACATSGAPQHEQGGHDASTPDADLPQCSDGIDNDGDGLIDYPADPGCFHPLDNSEEDDCPDGPNCPECADGIDNDGDGFIDWPDDLGCESASDTDESTRYSSECGSMVRLKMLPASGIAYGSAAPFRPSELESDACGGAGEEIVYLYDVPNPGMLYVSTAFDETTLDTAIYVRTQCSSPSTELGCSNRDQGATLSVPVEPGRHYIVVDAHSNTSVGDFKLMVELQLAEGTACDPETSACAPGLLCQHADEGAATETCVPPRCSDGIDNDGDGLIDWPADPGCASPEDNDETDDCPDGPNCPECADGIDNDGDGLIDWPADPGCVAAGHYTEYNCAAEKDLIEPITSATMSGSTVGLSNDFHPSCTLPPPSLSGPDKVYVLRVPGALASLVLDTAGSSLNTVLSIKPGSCDVADMACNDAGGPGHTSLIQLTDIAPGIYFVIVDGWGGLHGAYNLNVSGVIRSGEPCDPAQIAGGIFSCEQDGACEQGVCTPGTP